MGFVRKIGRAIDDAVHDIGSGIDDFVNDVIPGGWLGVAAGALLAVGITNPTLLGLAEEGALTAEALAAEGIDAAVLATDVAAVAPEVIAGAETALASGASAESIAALTAEELAGLGADVLTAGTDVVGLTSSELAGLGADAITAGTDVVGLTSSELAGLGADAATAGTDVIGLTSEELAGLGADAITAGTDVVGSVTPGYTGALTAEELAGLGADAATAGTDVVGAVTPGGTSLIDTIKNVGSTVVDTLGTSGLLTAGALLGSTLAGTGSKGTAATDGYAGSTPYTWGAMTPLTSTGINPGYIGAAASRPDYSSTNPTDARYYHGDRPLVMSEADLANYNKLPVGAPVTPWGAGPTAVGGQIKFNPLDFINQYINNPAYAGVNNVPGPVVPR